MGTHQPRPLTHSPTCFRIRLPLRAVSPWESPESGVRKLGVASAPIILLQLFKPANLWRLLPSPFPAHKKGSPPQ